MGVEGATAVNRLGQNISNEGGHSCKKRMRVKPWPMSWEYIEPHHLAPKIETLVNREADEANILHCVRSCTFSGACL